MHLCFAGRVSTKYISVSVLSCLIFSYGQITKQKQSPFSSLGRLFTLLHLSILSWINQSYIYCVLFYGVRVVNCDLFEYENIDYNIYSYLYF